MTAIAIFGDIHANLPALEAVLADMDRRGIGERYCLGDLVGYCVWPDEVTDTIRASNIPTIMGNYDLGVGNESDDCGCAYKDARSEALGKLSIAWSNDHTSVANKEYLRSLPASITLQPGGKRVLLVHGSPRKINEYLYEDRPDSSFERIVAGAATDVLVCGHTHIPYHRVLPGGKSVLNAGSVGKPKDGDPRACYILLDLVDAEISVQFVRVAYDIELAAAAIEASEMPPEYADMLRTGRG